MLARHYTTGGYAAAIFPLGEYGPFGVDTRGLRLERVVRLSRKGGRLNYVSLVGPAAALDSLDGQKDVLKQRGWRVGWGDRVAKGNETGGWGPRGLPTSIHQRFH